MPVEEQSKLGDPRCFVVSAAYGSFAQEVDLFRWFRDTLILATPGGEVAMDWYYNNSQPFADTIRENEWLRAVVLGLLLNDGLRVKTIC